MNEFAFGMIIVVMALSVFPMMVHYDGIAQDESCHNLGMKEYKYIMNAETCIDYSNKAHFVDIECTGSLWWQECKAEIISVGKVDIQ